MDWPTTYSDYISYVQDMRAHSIANASIESLKLMYMTCDDAMCEEEFCDFLASMSTSERRYWQRKWRVGYQADLRESETKFAAYPLLNPLPPEMTARLQAFIKDAGQ